MNSLAVLCERRGRFEEAAQLHAEVLEIRRRYSARSTPTPVNNAQHVDGLQSTWPVGGGDLALKAGAGGPAPITRCRSIQRRC